MIAEEKNDPSRRVTAAWQIHPGTVTAYEQVAVNLLSPWEGQIELMDGSKSLFKVQATKDGNGKMIRMILGFEASLISKKDGDIAKRALIPPTTEIVRQITGHDVGPKAISLDDLKVLMAEHRKGNYVAKVAVAA